MYNLRYLPIDNILLVSVCISALIYQPLKEMERSAPDQLKLLDITNLLVLIGIW